MKRIDGYQTTDGMLFPKHELDVAEIHQARLDLIELIAKAIKKNVSEPSQFEVDDAAAAAANAILVQWDLKPKPGSTAG